MYMSTIPCGQAANGPPCMVVVHWASTKGPMLLSRVCMCAAPRPVRVQGVSAGQAQGAVEMHCILVVTLALGRVLCSVGLGS